MLLTIGIIIATLILVNILLLIFSCNPSETEGKRKTAVKPVAPKGLRNKKSKYILYADK